MIVRPFESVAELPPEETTTSHTRFLPGPPFFTVIVTFSSVELTNSTFVATGVGPLPLAKLIVAPGSNPVPEIVCATVEPLDIVPETIPVTVNGSPPASSTVTDWVALAEFPLASTWIWATCWTC